MPSDTLDRNAAFIETVRREKARRVKVRERKARCEEDLMEFVRAFWPVLEPVKKLVEGWVLYAMVDLLMAVADGHHQHVTINVPPGSMKSLLLAVFFPAWMWGPQDQPHLRFLSASYSRALPERDNARFLQLISSADYQQLWGDRVQVSRGGMELVENTRSGWKRAVSSSGGTTGHRGDFFLLDDMNDPNNVESDEVRGSTTRYLTEVMPSRLNDYTTGVIINIQQRTHEQDATGVLADFWGGDQTWLCIPMEFDPLRALPVVMRTEGDGTPIQIWRDPRGLDRKGNQLEGIYQDNGILKVQMGSPMAQAEGEWCWPERFPPEELASQKARPYSWAGQYNQSPTVRGGGIIHRDWWQLWPDEEFPPLGTVVGSLDTAIKEGEQNDYNAFVSMGAFAGREGAPKLILTSAWHARMSLAELIRRTAESCYMAKVDYLIIEDKARGHDVAQEIVTQYADAPWQTILIPANGRGAFSGDKKARLEAVSVMFSGDVRRVPMTGDPSKTTDVWSGGMIYEPGREWSQIVVDQLAAFPSGAHDDYVDAVSMLLSFVRRNGVVVREVEFAAAEREKRKYRRTPTVPYAIQ